MRTDSVGRSATARLDNPSPTDGDVVDAEAAIERLAAAAPAEEGLAWRDIWLLRSGAVLARAHGDEAPYRESRDRYYDMARTLGFEGHTAWAEAIIGGGE